MTTKEFHYFDDLLNVCECEILMNLFLRYTKITSTHKHHQIIIVFFFLFGVHALFVTSGAGPVYCLHSHSQFIIIPSSKLLN